MLKRIAMWMTTVITVLVLGDQMFCATIPTLESAGVFAGAKTPADELASSTRAAAGSRTC